MFTFFVSWLLLVHGNICIIYRQFLKILKWQKYFWEWALVLLLKPNQRYFRLEYRSSHDAGASGNRGYTEEILCGGSEILCLPALLLQPTGGVQLKPISLPPLSWDHIQFPINFGIFALDGVADILQTCGRDKFEIKNCHHFLGEACGVNGVTTRPGTIVEILTHHRLFVLIWFFGFFFFFKSTSNNSAGLSGR